MIIANRHTELLKRSILYKCTPQHCNVTAEKGEMQIAAQRYEANEV